MDLSLLDPRGETDRRGFLVAWIVLTVALICGAVPPKLLAAAIAPRGSESFETIWLTSFGTFLALHAAVSFTFQSRRLRNMGAWGPMWIAGAILAVTAFDQFYLIHRTWLRMVFPLAHMTPLGGLAQLALHLFLLLWPARRRRAEQPAEAFA